MKALDDTARQYVHLFESLAHLPTNGVSVRITDEETASCDTEGVIYIPRAMLQPGRERELILAVRHELQHARDFLDNSQWKTANSDEFEKIVDSMEKRAYLAEVNSKLRVDPYWKYD